MSSHLKNISASIVCCAPIVPLFFAALGGEEGNGCLQPGHELLEMVLKEWGNDRIQRNLDVEVIGIHWYLDVEII